MPLPDFKRAVRRQTEIMRLDPAAAITALPQLLARSDSSAITELRNVIERVMTASDPLDKVEMARLHEMQGVFDKGASASMRRDGGKTPNAFDTTQDSGAPRSEQETTVS